MIAMACTHRCPSQRQYLSLALLLLLGRPQNQSQAVERYSTRSESSVRSWQQLAISRMTLAKATFLNLLGYIRRMTQSAGHTLMRKIQITERIGEIAMTK